MIVNSTKMELYFKSCLEARTGFSVLKESDQLMALISPTKDNLASCLPSSFSFSIPRIINLLLQVYQDGTTALQNHTASIFPRLQPGMKLHWHHATWSFTESIKSKTEAVIGYISICYPSTFNIGDIILLLYGKLARLGFFFILDLHPSSKMPSVMTVQLLVKEWCVGLCSLCCSCCSTAKHSWIRHKDPWGFCPSLQPTSLVFFCTSLF